MEPWLQNPRRYYCKIVWLPQALAKFSYIGLQTHKQIHGRLEIQRFQKGWGIESLWQTFYSSHHKRNCEKNDV